MLIQFVPWGEKPTTLLQPQLFYIFLRLYLQVSLFMYFELALIIQILREPDGWVRNKMLLRMVL